MTKSDILQEWRADVQRALELAALPGNELPVAPMIGMIFLKTAARMFDTFGEDDFVAVAKEAWRQTR